MIAYKEKTVEARRVELLDLASKKGLQKQFIATHDLESLEHMLLYTNNAAKCSECEAVYDNSLKSCNYCGVNNSEIKEELKPSKPESAKKESVNRKSSIEKEPSVKKTKDFAANVNLELLNQALEYTQDKIFKEFIPTKKYNLYEIKGKKFYMATRDNLIEIRKSWCPNLTEHEGIDDGYKIIRYTSVEMIKNILEEISK